MKHLTALLATTLAVAAHHSAAAEETPAAAPAAATPATPAPAPAGNSAANPAETPARTDAAERAADPTTVGAGVTAEAKTEPGESYPVSATFTLAYRLNHANFVGTESDSTNFGYQRGTLGADVSYALRDDVSIDANVTVDKELSTSFDRAALGGGAVAGGPSTRTKRETELRDVSLGVSWANFYKIPVVDIGLSGSFSTYLPTSKASQSAGVIMAVLPELILDWKAGGFTTSLTLDYSYYFNEDATVKVDRDNAPEIWRKSGPDTGIPNALQDWTATLAASYRILDPLTVKASYLISNGYGAADFPNDQYTAEFAQTGTQESTGLHSVSFSIKYAIFEKTTIGASMTTTRGIYTEDGKDITVPIFDFDSDLHHRTYYQLSLAQAI